MKNVIIVIAVGVIAGVGGYFIGNNGGTSAADAKKLQDSVTMMKEQSVALKQMSEMMQTAGNMMQSLGAEFGNDEAVTTGKDLTAVAAKYLKETDAKTNGSGSMKEMMN